MRKKKPHKKNSKHNEQLYKKNRKREAASTMIARSNGNKN